MASQQPNTNWYNIPGTSQISWKTETKPSCDCPHDDAHSHTRSKSEAGLPSTYHIDPVLAQNRCAPFSAASSSHTSQFSSSGQSRGTSFATSNGSSRNVSWKPSLIDLVKALPPVLETTSGVRFNTAEFTTSIETPLLMEERHQKIRSAIETLESIIRYEEQEYQRRQQRIIEQQRLQEQQRQQQQISYNTNWTQNTSPSYTRNGSVSILDEIQTEHNQRACEASLKKEETERGRSFSIFKSKKKVEAASPVRETRERKASEWGVDTVQFRERQGSDWYTTATEAKQRKGSSDSTGDTGFRERQDSGWYSAASERKASIASVESNMRKGGTVSMASNFRKGSIAGMPKQRRPSEWGASTACFA